MIVQNGRDLSIGLQHISTSTIVKKKKNLKKQHTPEMAHTPKPLFELDGVKIFTFVFQVLSY